VQQNRDMIERSGAAPELRPQNDADGGRTPVRESAVLVPVPAADTALGELRRRLDRVGGARVPAHVTVVYPFVPPERIDGAVEAAVARAVASVEVFETEFGRIDWFGDGVLFLAPEPDVGFRRLIAAVVAAFPQHPPYGGAYRDVVPHLTLGASVPPEQLTAAVPAVRAALPLRARITHALLMEGAGDEPWQVRARLPLH